MSTMTNAMNIALEQESNHGDAALKGFLSLIQSEDIRASQTIKVADWVIGCFEYKNATFTAAYSDLQESVRILNLRVNDWYPLSIFSSDLNTIEMAFCSWLDQVQA